MKYWPVIAVVGLPACLFAAIAPEYVKRFHLSAASVIGIYGCFALLLLLALAPGIKVARSAINQWLSRSLMLPLLPLAWCVPYLVYAAGTWDFKWWALARLLAVGAVLPAIYGCFPVRDAAKFSWQDFLVAVWLIAALLSHQLAGIWNVPVNLDFLSRLFLIAVASWSWAFLRRVPELGYDFSFSFRSAGWAALSFAGFAVIAIPVGLATHFIRWDPRHRGLGFLVDYAEIFLFIALLEELFFRGFLQSLISRRWGSVRKGHVLVSCLFGLFHILHTPFPNWRYVLLATVAGWFYGWAFIRSGNLMAPVMTHALVDTVWRNYF